MIMEARAYTIAAGIEITLHTAANCVLQTHTMPGARLHRRYTVDVAGALQVARFTRPSRLTTAESICQRTVAVSTTPIASSIYWTSL